MCRKGSWVGITSVHGYLYFYLTYEKESLNELQAAFRLDARPEKADLMCGVYQTQDGKPYVLPSVKLVSINDCRSLREHKLILYRLESDYSTTPIGIMSIRHLTLVRLSSVMPALA